MSMPIGTATRASHQSIVRTRVPDAAGGTPDASAMERRAAPTTVASITPAGERNPRPWLGSRESVVGEPSAGDEALAASHGAGGGEKGAPAADPALAAVTRRYEARLADLAADPEAFHRTLATAFGGGYDRAEAEGIRQQVLAGDFSWMPEIRVVDGAALGDRSGTQGPGAQGLGAYDAAGDTIYLSRELLEGDPSKAVEILTEEVGHGLDARLNASDAAGDEGDIFSRLVGGETISAGELAALRTENDSGTILVDGREVQVEYGGLGGVVRKIGKGISSAVKGAVDFVKDGVESIKDGVKSAVDAVKGAFKWVMESELMGMILTVAQFVPIPIVAVAARVINVARSAYMAYRGLKEGSMAMVLGGIAGAAGGVGKLGEAFGASAKFVEGAASVSRYAGMASQAHAVLAERDLSAALSLAKSAFGANPSIAPHLQTAENLLHVKRAADRGDVLGAAGIGVSALSAIPGMERSAELSRAGEHLATIGAMRTALDRGDLGTAATLLTSEYGDALGLAPRARRTVEDVASVLGTLQTAKELFDGHDYGGAARTLIGRAAERAPAGSALRQNLIELGRTFERVDGAVADIDRGHLHSASETVLSLLGEPLDAVTRERLLGLLERIESLGGPAAGGGAGVPAAA